MTDLHLTQRNTADLPYTQARILTGSVYDKHVLRKADDINIDWQRSTIAIKPQYSQ